MLLVLVLVAAVTQLAIGNVFGLFSSTTSNANNSFSASTCFQPFAVSIANFSFTPASVTIAAGCSVRWTQTSSTKHTTTSTTGVWNSGQLNQGQTYTRQFVSAGSFPYRCTLHPGSMTGTITVT
ncbi:MAG TPA: plastocyanin/azurin family copper-binding protein [Solirubrobacteraceae bacterium]|nr:plastocyanin/azurin family copper-binding protein [Solirubrobacteraceae bacterium]